MSRIHSLLRCSLFLAFCASVTVGQELVLTPEGDTDKDAGDNYFVKCQVTGVTPSQNPTWHDQSDSIISGQNSGGTANLFTVLSGTDGSVLYFSPVQESHEGSYTCKYDSSSTSFVLSIIVPISFGDTEANQEAVINKEELIECEATGTPSPTVTWVLPNGRVLEDGYEVTSQGLSILNTVEDDEGMFICHAEVSSLGTFDDKFINLNVLYPPNITPLEDDVGLEDANIELDCQADGDPEPEITWSFGGNDLINGDKYEYVNGGELLRIMNLTESDIGEYSCTAENKVDAATDTLNLNVYLKPEIGPETNLTVTKDQLASFTCEATRGTPAPELFWSDSEGNKFPIGPSDENRILVSQVDDSNLKLDINKVEVDDEGFFTCMAKNVAGDDAQNFFLDVKYPPVVNNELTKSEVNSWIGNPTNITCVIEGDPVPLITWDKNGEEFNTSFEYTIETDGFSSYFLFTAYEEAFGEYRCVGTNEIDGATSSTEEVITLNKAVEPGMPTDLAVDETYSTTLRLTLKKPEDDGGEAITYYRVRARKENFEEEDPLIQDIAAIELDSEGSILAKDLEPGMMYEIDVAAVNPVGAGVYSSSLSQEMRDAQEPYEPTITSTNQADTSSYTLKWQTPIDDGGSEILTYTIKYSRKSNELDEPVYIEEKTLSGISATLNEYLVEDLKSSSNYKMTLFATNSYGDGDSASIEFSTKEAAKTEAPVTDKPPVPGQAAGTLTTGAVVGIVIAVCILLLILIDISCYFMNDCGITHFLCFSLCGKSDSEKDDVEMGGVKRLGSDGNVVVGDAPLEPADQDSGPPPEDKPLLGGAGSIDDDQSGKQEEAQEKPKESDPNATEEEQKALMQGKTASPDDVKIEPTDREDDNTAA